MKLLLLCCFLYCVDLIGTQDLDNINNLSTLEIADGYGYPIEEHKVTTSDGYILTLHRIPSGKNCESNNTKGPVLVQHGLLSSSADWVIMGPHKGLAFILADRCYDVWMGNSRGNYYSKEHTELTVNQDEFWKFSWHEMGMYDLPAVIDYILENTGSPDLFYIGHSQGTTQFWIFNEFHSSYQKKVKAMFALAPIAFLGHSKSLALQAVSRLQYIASWVVEWIGWNEFFPKDGLISQLGETFCRESIPLMTDICSNIVFLICGFDSDQMNRAALPTILAHTPAGASTRQVLHYAQSVNSGKFRQYDHGMLTNLQTYGSFSPPSYQLENVNIPVYLFYSANDWLAEMRDVAKLKSGLGNVAGDFLIPFEKWNHLDFLWALQVDTLVYDKLIEEMDKLIEYEKL